MSRIQRLSLFLAAMPMSRPAFAHGEEVLITIFAEAITVAICCTVGWILLRKCAKTDIAIMGCVLGVLASWVVTSDMPYRENMALITAIAVVFPIIGTAIAIFFAKKNSSDKHVV